MMIETTKTMDTGNTKKAAIGKGATKTHSLHWDENKQIHFFVTCSYTHGSGNIHTNKCGPYQWITDLSAFKVDKDSKETIIKLNEWKIKSFYIHRFRQYCIFPKVHCILWGMLIGGKLPLNILRLRGERSKVGLTSGTEIPHWNDPLLRNTLTYITSTSKLRGWDS